MARRSARPDFALTALCVLSGLAFLEALFEYFWTGNGVHGSEGALLVVVSTLLMLIAAALITYRLIGGWLKGLFEVLLLLDFLGTASAAYLLQTWLLVALVVLAFVAWIAHIVRPASSVSVAG